MAIYYCTKCKRNHIASSNIGREHLEYKHKNISEEDLHYVLFSVIAGGMIGLLLDFLSKPWSDFHDSTPGALVESCLKTDVCNLINKNMGTIICNFLKVLMNSTECIGILSNLIIYLFIFLSIFLLIILFKELHELGKEGQLEITKIHLLFTVLFSIAPFYITSRFFTAFLYLLPNNSNLVFDCYILILLYIALVFFVYFYLFKSKRKKALIIMLIILFILIVINQFSNILEGLKIILN